MKALFLGGFAAAVAPRILARVTTALQTEILADERDRERLVPALSEAEIVVGHIWRSNFPPAPRLKLLQSVAAGLDQIDLAALPGGIVVCNVFGHEPAIAEYVIMTMLALTHRLFDTLTTFRAGSWAASQMAGGSPHGEVLGRTVGIIGYGRIGREVARRAAALGCRVIGANRSRLTEIGAVERVYSLSEPDQMLPQCDVVVIACALTAETHGLIDARRLGLMKPSAFLINVARGEIVDEDALYAVLRGGRIAGAAIDVWWRYTNPSDQQRRPSRHPFHELPNVLMTPHCSGFTDGTVERRWGAVAGNIDRFIRGEALVNVVTST
jgi:phosphoglycerate dehydrogenase-like enzyme